MPLRDRGRPNLCRFSQIFQNRYAIRVSFPTTKIRVSCRLKARSRINKGFYFPSHDISFCLVSKALFLCGF